MALDFWKNHAKEMRRARLLHAAALLRAIGLASDTSVSIAIGLEEELDKQLLEKSKTEEGRSGNATRRSGK